MRVGYCVPVMPELASYRLRVEIPSRYLTCPYVIGATGRPTFFFKNGHLRVAESLAGGVVYDVVNDHFRSKYAADYHGMCGVADKITCASEAMAEIVHHHTGRDATVIDDPYENDEQEPACDGDGVLWFGHSANIGSLDPYADIPRLSICSNYSRAHIPWSIAAERDALAGCAVVLATGNNPGASANRIVKALRAGRFVVAPASCPASWKQLGEYIWVGDPREGVRWALHNREEACKKIRQGQQHLRERFSPEMIGRQWMEVFASV